MSTRDWLATHIPVEELEAWGADTIRALVTLIDNLKGNPDETE